jgi:hypothetical protein
MILRSIDNRFEETPSSAEFFSEKCCAAPESTVMDSNLNGVVMDYNNFRDQQYQTRKLYSREDRPKIISRTYLSLGLLAWLLAMVLGIGLLWVAILWDHFVDLFTALLVMGVIFGIWRFNKKS